MTIYSFALDSCIVVYSGAKFVEEFRLYELWFIQTISRCLFTAKGKIEQQQERRLSTPTNILLVLATKALCQYVNDERVAQAVSALGL